MMVAAAAPPPDTGGEDEPPTGTDQERTLSFEEELRARNLQILTWGAALFNVIYLAWTVFDRFLAPEHWGFFLILRLASVVISSAVVIAVRRSFPTRTWEGYWIVTVVYGLFIAPMLQYATDSRLAYLLGFTLTIYGAGVLPFWPPVWAATNIFVNIAIALVAMLVSSQVSFADTIAATFFITTGSSLSLMFSYFKHDLARRDYSSRTILAKTTGELETALEALKEVDRTKNKFFANISHELRTPLTLILAPVQELRNQISDESEQRYLDTVQRNAERLLRLIDDLLDLSRLDARGLRLNVAEVDLGMIATSVYEASRATASSANKSFEISIDPAPPVYGDAHRLEIVITNLVGNALKYTPAGGAIALSVEQADRGVAVTVSDTGPGIPEEDLPFIFDRFYQVSGAGRRRHDGVGIGLALARELVHLHGGQMQVSSVLGEGTSFSFCLPLGQAHIHPDVVERRHAFRSVARSRRLTDPPTSDGLSARPSVVAPELPSPVGSETSTTRRPKILVAEDQPELQSFIAELLRPDYDVVTASSGDEAWNLVRATTPDLVISDVMMPGLTGTELCRAIKSHAELRSTAVILLTAKTGSEATLEGYAHGADDFAPKPFHPRVLLARVRAQLKLRALMFKVAQDERLVAIGAMAAGILHEVRNPVNAILNAARVLDSSPGPSSELTKKMCAVILDGAERLSGVTTALDTHTRPAEENGLHDVEIKAGLEATLRLLEHRLANVTVQRDYRTDGHVQGNAGQINQVLLNIIDNALRSGAGEILVGVERVADSVVTRIEDNGPGIPDDVASRVFDPFFTTRPNGSGTGLGLHISRQIVEEHSGSITLSKSENGGTVFTVTLPASG